ncbi:hypothetical protein BOX15_Mlig027909g1 [Macrostomum lignano]|uniref:Uncharacterized protein n=2 Tax=Macrostomum lignano TaxID=282301 RepID=A0A1I8J9T3_9PLAT|nr:hypothetical protein BOX15_Mlig027909g1 [Macrostomum lignano]
MKSTWSYFKGRIRRKGAAAVATAPKSAASVSEWDDEAPAACDGGQIPCKNRRVTDGSLLTCLGSDASALADKTRLSRTRAWRYLEWRWWLSGCQPAASAAAATEADSLLPSPSVPADPSARPLLQPHLRRSISICCFDDDFPDSLDSIRPRRNSLSELDENVGSDLPVKAWHIPVDAETVQADKEGALQSPAAADLISFDNLP